MPKKRREYSAQFKFRVAVEALREQKTINELASEHQVHPTLVRDWKRLLLTSGASVFERGQKAPAQKENEVPEAELYEQIGRLKMELEWVKKKAGQFGGN
jgi:transposase-like protein